MAGTTLERLIRESDSLTVEELIRLANEFQERAKRRLATTKPSWLAARGMLELEDGIEAQDWISALRQESERTFGNEE
jgi:hypothetical protein